MKKLISILVFSAVLCRVCLAGFTNDLWTYPDRIPVLCVAPNGGILAFASHKPTGVVGDDGYSIVTLRRSMDNGATWTAMQTVADDGTNTFGTGAVIVDPSTGKIFLLDEWNLANDTEAQINAGTSVDVFHIYLQSSSDSGTNWTAPVDISSSLRPAGDWRVMYAGPATGSTLSNGRLITSGYHGLGTNTTGVYTNYYPHTIYSDDHGTTWHYGESATNPIISGFGENSIVQLTNGNIMMISRNDYTAPPMGVSISTDSGATWSAFTNSATLNGPGCFAPFIRYTKPPAYGKTRLLFADPDNNTVRADGRVRLSYDEGQTWPVVKQYFPTLFGYSALTVLPNGDWAILAENGTNTYYDKITFISDTLSNLTSGADALDPQTNSQPTLSVSISGTNVLVSWPASATNFSLQQNIDPNGTSWTNPVGAGPIVVTNGQNQLWLSPTNADIFFRLISP